ncbi:aspartate aminotransferase family protein [Puniceicoccus vermicola]|uniref:Acetylornithine aminotransferase n=1 Tax=Puniceicoccus vermicola TaxID=388746 RepID=A0A7X1E4C5_9BACT|nr:aspartate aminotransferase family protein [Puniceicoccus vermicola]MBC2601848.1 aspartate aminotransferase family protein [Puniceicoccus vermicola]
MNENTQNQYDSYLIHNYGAPAISLVSGKGASVQDDQGREYLDFTSGIAVNALGHSHPDWVESVSKQAGTLIHCSNLFATPKQGELAERLSRYTPKGRFLFCNSGTEANEALIKLARLHGRALAGEEGKRYTVITAENAFHGRTFGGMAATPQEKIQNGFRPMLPGFRHAKLNDIDSFAEQIDDEVCAVLLETIQGESGINPAKPEFLRDLRALCTERNVLLLIDEVQCGVGRSGKFYAYEYAGIEPDAIGMAKGLAGGFPIGAIWVAEAYADLFTPGSHGTTFGGTPLACSAALAVLDVIEKENLLERITRQSEAWHQELRNLAAKLPHKIKQVRGLGYLVGVGLTEPPLPVVAKLREAGLLTAPAGNNTVRLIPPLIATEAELQKATQILEQVLSD